MTVNFPADVFKVLAIIAAASIILGMWALITWVDRKLDNIDRDNQERD